MKRTLSFILAVVLLMGLIPMQAFATEMDLETQNTEPTVVTEVDTSAANTSISSNPDLFVFAGQSNMMGAAVLEPEVNTFTEQAWEYKYMPKLRGAETGTFVPAQNSAGEWYYNDLNAAYGDYLNDLTYQSSLSNYSQNTYFCPAMSNGTKGFSAQSEANMYPSASLPPYFVTEYASYGHPSIYAHMAKGSVKIVHYFTTDMMDTYNALISEYNAENGKSYKLLTTADLTGAGDAFDEKYESMLEDYVACTPDGSINNKCFVWLQGESDGSSYIEYKLKMRVLWEHLQTLGFTHFFVLRVGYWGNTGILNIIKAQEDFCTENEGCYIVTRAPSLIPHPTATTENWWINEPDAQYADCRDSYVVPGSGNHHFNEKAMQIFAERSAENIHRILYQGLDPVLEEENIQGLVKEEQKPEEEQPEDTTPYASYVGTDDFNKGLSVSTSSGKWVEKTSSTAASTDLIPVTSDDSVWIQYVFYLSEAHAVGGFYDKDGNLVAPLYYKDFGFSLGGGGGTAAFLTPEATNRVSIADVESATGKEVAYVRFTAWQASAGGHANTEARIYHSHSYTPTVTAPTCTSQGYTTYTCACGDSYVDDYVDATDHGYGAWEEITAPTCDAEGQDMRTCSACGDAQYRDTRISGDPNKILVSNPVAEDFFEGKVIMAIGDSLTAGTLTTKEERYHYLTAQALGMTNINSGTSGAVLCPGGYLPNKFDTLMTVELLTSRDVDVVTIFLGVNDWNNGVLNGTYRGALKYDPEDTWYDLGEFGTDDTTTIYGAAKMWCERILELQATEECKDIQFVFMTPVILSRNRSLHTQDDWSQDKTNVFGYTLRQYCTAIMEVCTYYGIPVLDLNMYSGMYYHSETNNNVEDFGGDGIHPGPNGHRMMADALTEFLLEGYSYEERTVTDCGHSYEAVVTAPTCWERGYTTYTCPKCYYSYTGDYVDTVCVSGDVNGDGKVNTLDRVILSRYLAKWDGYDDSALCLTAADVNQDGKVNTLDRVILSRYLAKWSGYETLPLAK